MNTKEIIIWTSEPDYEEYRTVMEEDMPYAGEEERKAWFFAANERCLAFQQSEMKQQLGMPILILKEEEDGWYQGAGIIESGDLADCFALPNDRKGSCTWLLDLRGDLCLRIADGAEEQRYIYRLQRQDLSPCGFLSAESFGTSVRLHRSELAACTLRVGDAVARVYGLELPPDPQAGISLKWTAGRGAAAAPK